MEYDIKKICRCCLKNIGDMKPLYGASLNKMLHCVTNLEVTPNDGFPELLCFQCVLQLSRAYRFKEECIQSYKIILGYIERSKTPTKIYEYSEVESSFEPVEEDVSEDNMLLDVEATLACAEHLNERKDAELREELIKDNGQEYHKMVHETGSKYLYKCSICTTKFSSRKKLNRHIKTHNKPYKCLKCNKTFSEKSNLKKHFYKHSGELRNTQSKIYLCSVCGKIFKYSSSLAKHIKFHTGKNLLHCSHCPKSFAERSALENHLRIHTGDRPYNCQKCNRKFTQLCNLRKHLRSHNNETISSCPISKNTLHTKIQIHTLRMHMQFPVNVEKKCL